MTLTLNHPVTIGEKTISEVSFRRARVKDIEAIQNAVENDGEMGASIVSISCLTGLKPDEVREIDGEDFVRIAEAISDFLPKTAVKPGVTGAESSPTLQAS